jgi:hypothetical protein
MMGGMDWIDLAQDRDRWQGLVNALESIKYEEFVN